MSEHGVAIGATSAMSKVATSAMTGTAVAALLTHAAGRPNDASASAPAGTPTGASGSAPAAPTSANVGAASEVTCEVPCEVPPNCTAWVARGGSAELKALSKSASKLANPAAGSAAKLSVGAAPKPSSLVDSMTTP